MGDTLVREYSAYGYTPVYRRPDDSMYVLYHGVRYGADDWRALRAAILEYWRPHDQDGRNVYCRMAANENHNVWSDRP